MEPKKEQKYYYTERQLQLLEEQRRSGKLGQQQKEWQKEQDKLLK